VNIVVKNGAELASPKFVQAVTLSPITVRNLIKLGQRQLKQKFK
jgi:hypothetical protein